MVRLCKGEAIVTMQLIYRVMSILLLSMGIGWTAPLVAIDSRLAGDEKRTRFVMDVDQSFQFSVFALSDPYRVIIDLPETEFKLTDDSGLKGKGLVGAYRYGLFAPGKSRIVLDATAPFRIDRAFVLEPIEEQPARLVVDIVKIDRDEFLQTQAERRRKQDVARRQNITKSDKKNIRQKAKTRPIIVLDPGHGGIDGGAKGQNGIVEKIVVLKFAKILKQELENGGHFEVFLTREGDNFISLNSRINFARSHHADLFVSIHADTLPQKELRGATIYTLSKEASDKQSAFLAEKENRADLLAGLDLSQTPNDVVDILMDLTRRETKKFSVQFSRTLIDGLRPTTKLVRNPLRSAGFRVLKAPEIPSILLELGFLSNTTDEKLLNSPKWRQQTAKAIKKSIMSYFTQHIAQRP